jgi:hypothetical protein
MRVGVMRDYKIKLRNLHASHALGCTTKQTRNTYHTLNFLEVEPASVFFWKIIF